MHGSILLSWFKLSAVRVIAQPIFVVCIYKGVRG